MSKHTNRIGTSLLVAIMKGKHKWSTKLPPLIHDGGGLYLQPRGGGGGAWKFRYTALNGKPTFAGLGRLEDVSAPEARRQRDILKSKLRAGGDPIRDRQRDAAMMPMDANEKEVAGQICMLLATIAATLKTIETALAQKPLGPLAIKARDGDGPPNRMDEIEARLDRLEAGR